MSDNTFSWTLPPGPPLTDAQRALVVSAMHLVPAVVVRFIRSRPAAHQYQDELPSVAHEGLIRAAQRFRPGGNTWLSYAYGGAFMQCRAWFQAMQRRDAVSLDAPVAEGADVTWLELHTSSTADPEDAVFQRQVLVMVEQLPERERAAMERHLDGRTLEDVGEEHGCTRGAAHLWERSALRMMRTRLGVEEPEPIRKKAAPVDGRERLLALLTDGTPRTVRELVGLTGYSRQGLGTTLRAVGAVQVGTTSRNGTSTPLWAIPREAT